MAAKAYYAHSLPETADKAHWQSLRDHLSETGKLAGKFGLEFGMGNPAQLAGLLHDLGKYTDTFQSRLEGKNIKVDHAAPGAVEVKAMAQTQEQKIIATLLSFAIAGHHAGLDDTGKLQDRLAAFPDGKLDPQWKEEIADATASLLIPERYPKKGSSATFSLGFLGRMLFSCLVDADYKDTERFYKGAVPDRIWPDLRENIDLLIARFDASMEKKQKDARSSPLNDLRRQILDHACGQHTMPKGLFTLTVPTGGGKTLASLGFALKHAKTHHMRRIVYAIPFTSIIEQNAEVFRETLNDSASQYILEHHASLETEKISEQKGKLRLAMEDWAAPIVVTTNVQLFESLFANRSSRCRKLHNLANSILILDEAQTLPLPLLRPCMAALDELARNYGASIILCTATQPALDKRDFGKGGFTLEGRELAPNPQELSRLLRRTQITRETTPQTDQDLAAALAPHDQALVIVNSRKHALALYNKAQQDNLTGLVHLSTRQCAIHRQEILKEVREMLKNQRPCRLIATSLVEAGVDIDFPRVFRAETGLDQIAQAAGRCNREGRNQTENSIVTIFKPADHQTPKEFATMVQGFDTVAANFAPEDLLSPDALKAYFREVYWQKGTDFLDHKKILSDFSSSGQEVFLNYKTAAEKFQMIEKTMAPIIIPVNAQVQEILDRMQSPEASPGKALRDLQPFLVQTPQNALATLVRCGRVTYHRQDLWGDQFAVLSDEGFETLYKKETGLSWEDAEDIGCGVF